MRCRPIPTLCAVALGLLWAPPLLAQPDSVMIDPSPTFPDKVEEPEFGPQPQAEPGPGAEEGQAGQAGDEEAVDPYFGDYLDEGGDPYETPDNDAPSGGAVPTTHTVRSGDTLWDISQQYFGDPWTWPKVWGLNPEITNPHWIYPGNLVRLREGGATQPGAAARLGEPDGGQSAQRARRPSTAPNTRVGLRQLAYVDTEELQDAGRVIGSVDEKTLLSMGDSIYVSYEEGRAPSVGDTYSIYAEATPVKRDGETVGSFVQAHGEVRITYSKPGQHARGVITRSVRSIERGMRVGPLELSFNTVEPVANETKLDGHIVDLISPDYLIGTDQAVIIDRGSEDGVQAGNRFLVVRRGDAYSPVMEPGESVGKDDEAYPARAIAEVLVVQSGDRVSVGMVTFAIQEFGVGDRVFMRQGQ